MSGTTASGGQLEVDVRPERPGDEADVETLVARAFGGDGESRVVAALRHGERAVSLVAVAPTGIVVGHVLFTPVHLEAPDDRDDLVGLAPLAVEPAAQRRGVGRRLVLEGLRACRAAGCSGVVVLGDPAYYGRFGFVRAADLGLRCRWPGTEVAFQALELEPGAWSGRSGLVLHDPVFDQV